MAITGANFLQYLTIPSGNTWGIAVIGNELFVTNGGGGDAVNAIYVYDILSKTLLRSMTTPLSGYWSGLGTNGVDLLISDTSGYTHKVNKTTLIPESTRYTPYASTNLANCAESFSIDESRNYHACCSYGGNTVYIKNLTTGAAIKNYTIGTTVHGICSYDKYLIVSTTSNLYIAEIPSSNNLTNLTFTAVPHTGINYCGVAFSPLTQKAYFSSYSTWTYSMDIQNLFMPKMNLSVNKLNMVTPGNVQITGSIEGYNSSQVKYSVYINNVVFTPETSLSNSPVSINISVSANSLSVGNNSIKIVSTDSNGYVNSSFINVFKPAPYLAINGRDFSPLSTNSSTSSATLWIYGLNTASIDQHANGSGSYATAVCASSVYNSTSKVTGVTLPNCGGSKTMDIYAYGRSYSLPGIWFRLNGGAWVVPSPGMTSTQQWHKVGSGVSISTGDLWEMCSQGGGAQVDVVDVAFVPAGGDPPLYTPTGQEGTRNTLNSPPSNTLVVDRTTTHSNDAVLSGSISDSDGDQIQYSISVNENIVVSTTALANSPVSVNYTIPVSSLAVGSNSVVVNYNDSKGGSGSKTFSIEFTNSTPVINASVDRESTYSSPVYLTATFSDGDGDNYNYRILINGNVEHDWYGYGNNSTFGISIPYDSFDIGNNTITVECKDVFGSTSYKEVYVKRKQYDSTYLTESASFPYASSLELNDKNIILIKIPDVNRSEGYLSSASLSINLLSSSGGDIHIAPVVGAWEGSTVSASNPPVIGASQAVTVTLPNISGIVALDITKAAQQVYDSNICNGIAIYSVSTTASISILEITPEYSYVSTTLTQPQEVSMKGVNLSWKSYISLSQVVGCELQKSQTEEFSSFTQVYNDTGKNEYVDTDIHQGTWYYRVVLTHGDSSTEISNVISTPIPEAGYRGIWNGTQYIVTMAQGIAFDDSTMDYNFYTTPDRIKLRVLQIGSIIGGHTSDIYEVEVINGYDLSNFDVKLRISYSGQLVDTVGSYCSIPDNDREDLRTIIEMSLEGGGAFTPVYPLTFRLNAQTRRLFYIRVRPSTTTSGDTTFQIMLTGTPV